MFKEVIPGVRAQLEPFTGSIYIIHQNRIRKVNEGSESYPLLYSVLLEDPWPHPFPKVPFNVQIQVTLACNFACSFCYANAINEINSTVQMSFERACQLIDILHDWGVPTIQWVGGEAFVHKSFPEIVEYARERGFIQTIITNGIIPGLHFEKYKDTLVSFSAIQVSMNAIGANFNKLVGRDIYEKFKIAIGNLASIIDEVWLSCVLTPKNYHDIPEIVKVAELSGVRGVIFGYLAKKGRGSDTSSNYFSFQKEADSIMRTVVKSHPNVAIYYHLNSELNYLNNICTSDCVDSREKREGTDILYINKDGNIYPFPTLELPELKIGNVFKDKLCEAWIGSSVLNEMRSAYVIPYVCNDCTIDCSLRSLSSKYLWYGTFIGKIPCARFNYER